MLNKIMERIAELEKDYQNITSTISRLDQDKANLIQRGISIRGALDELNRLKIIAEEPQESRGSQENVNDVCCGEHNCGECNNEVK